jgi:hypothetical protein
MLRNIPEDAILHSRRRENLKSCNTSSLGSLRGSVSPFNGTMNEPMLQFQRRI